MKNQIELDLEDNPALEELFDGATPGDEGTLKNVKYKIVDHLPGKKVSMNVVSVSGKDVEVTDEKSDDDSEEDNNLGSAVLNSI